MRSIRQGIALVALAVVGLIVGFGYFLDRPAVSQTTVTPSGIYDLVRNNITAQETLTSTGTTALVGATTATGLITANGGISGAVTPGTAGIIPASTSVRNVHSGGYPAIISTSGNDSTPVITETYVFEMFVPVNATITGVALFNGTNVTGNVTVGLATAAGAPIAAALSASTAGSGTDAYQRIPFAVAYAAKGPALYYVQVQYSSGTARYNTHTVGNFGCLVQTAQTYGVLTSFTPPTTFVTNVCNIASLY